MLIRKFLNPYGLRGYFNSLVVTDLINLLYVCASVLITANIIQINTNHAKVQTSLKYINKYNMQCTI